MIKQLLIIFSLLYLVSGNLISDGKLCYASQVKEKVFQVKELLPKESTEKMVSFGKKCNNLNLKSGQIIESDLLLTSTPREMEIFDNEIELDITLSENIIDKLKIELDDIKIINKKIVGKKLRLVLASPFISKLCWFKLHIHYIFPMIIPIYSKNCCHMNNRWYRNNTMLYASDTTNCRDCKCINSKWTCCVTRPELHIISRGTTRYGELLAFLTSWVALKRDGISATYGYEDNALMQNLMSHGVWFDDAHGTSWFLPWHREYLYRIEKLLINKWLEIRADSVTLKSYGWPSQANGDIYSNEWYTDGDGITSYIKNPENICVRLPFWHWPKDAGQSPNSVGLPPMAPYDPQTFGSTGYTNTGNCVEDGFFSNQNSATTVPYVLGDWGSTSNPSDMRVNNNNRCLKRVFNPSSTTTFLDEITLDNLINSCPSSSNQWVTWMTSFEVTPHFAGHTYTSGHMTSGLSSLDPLFFIHHAGVDRGWYKWQDNCASASGYTTKQCGSWGYDTVSGSSSSGWPNTNTGTSGTRTDDQGASGGTVGTVYEHPITFDYNVPNNPVGSTMFEKGCDQSKDAMQPFSDWDNNYITPSDVLDSEKLLHTCSKFKTTHSLLAPFYFPFIRQTNKCDCVKYANKNGLILGPIFVPNIESLLIASFKSQKQVNNDLFRQRLDYAIEKIRSNSYIDIENNILRQVPSIQKIAIQIAIEQNNINTLTQFFGVTEEFARKNGLSEVIHNLKNGIFDKLIPTNNSKNNDGCYKGFHAMNLKIKSKILKKEDIDNIHGIPIEFFTKCILENCFHNNKPFNKTGLQCLEESAGIIFDNKPVEELIADVCGRKYKDSDILSCQLVARSKTEVAKNAFALSKNDSDDEKEDYWGIGLTLFIVIVGIGAIFIISMIYVIYKCCKK